MKFTRHKREKVIKQIADEVGCDGFGDHTIYPCSRRLVEAQMPIRLIEELV